MIKEALEKIGLTEGESQVYTALIELGQTSTGKITKKANIASSKVYEVLQRLMNKGLVSYIIKNGVRHYDATPPERLIDFLEEKKSNINKAQDEIKKIIPKIKQKRKETKTKNQTIVYTGPEGPKIALNEYAEIGKRKEEVVGFGTDEDDYLKLFPAQLNEFVKTAKKYKFRERLLFGEGFKSPNVNAKKRFLPKEFMIPVRTMVYGNKVAIVDFTKPMTTIIIEKEEIAESYKTHFNLLWDIAGGITKIIHGKEGAVRVLHELVEAGRKGLPNYGFGTDINPYDKYLRKELNWFNEQEKKYNIKTKLLFMKGTEKHINPYAEMRFLPKEFISPLRIMIAGDKVFMVDFTKPWTTIIIRKKEIANSFIKHFELLWKIAKK